MNIQKAGEKRQRGEIGLDKIVLSQLPRIVFKHARRNFLSDRYAGAFGKSQFQVMKVKTNKKNCHIREVK